MSARIISGVFWCCFTSGVGAADVSPALINTTGISVYQDAAATQLVREPASPAILTGVTNHGAYEVWLADGRYAWVTTKPATVPVQVSLTNRLDVTTQPVYEETDNNFRWFSIAASDKPCDVLSIAPRAVNETPPYLSAAGRANLLDDASSPYRWRSLRLQCATTRGWAMASGLKFQTGASTTPLQFSGLVRAPFVSLMTAPYASEQEIKVYDLIQQRRVELSLEGLNVRPESVAVDSSDDAPQDKQDIARIEFIVAKTDTHLLRIVRNDGTAMWAGFLPPEGERIDTPLIVDYWRANVRGSAHRDFVFKLAHVSGDDFAIDWLIIDGAAFTLKQAVFRSQAEPAPVSALETVRQFYERYLNYRYTGVSGRARPAIAFSKSFAQLAEENATICATHATGICGWRASGDEYLDTQETDPELSYDNSRIDVKNIGNGVIRVKLNVYPSEKNNPRYYDKTITYRMIQEHGQWVVDDLEYADGGSVRKNIKEENQYYLANPDPDSSAFKQTIDGKK